MVYFTTTAFLRTTPFKISENLSTQRWPTVMSHPRFHCHKKYQHGLRVSFDTKQVQQGADTVTKHELLRGTSQFNLSRCWNCFEEEKWDNPRRNNLYTSMTIHWMSIRDNHCVSNDVWLRPSSEILLLRRSKFRKCKQTADCLHGRTSVRCWKIKDTMSSMPNTKQCAVNECGLCLFLWTIRLLLLLSGFEKPNIRSAFPYGDCQWTSCDVSYDDLVQQGFGLRWWFPKSAQFHVFLRRCLTGNERTRFQVGILHNRIEQLTAPVLWMPVRIHTVDVALQSNHVFVDIAIYVTTPWQWYGRWTRTVRIGWGAWCGVREWLVQIWIHWSLFLANRCHGTGTEAIRLRGNSARQGTLKFLQLCWSSLPQQRRSNRGTQRLGNCWVLHLRGGHCVRNRRHDRHTTSADGGSRWSVQGCWNFLWPPQLLRGPLRRPHSKHVTSIRIPRVLWGSPSRSLYLTRQQLR